MALENDEDDEDENNDDSDAPEEEDFDGAEATNLGINRPNSNKTGSNFDPIKPASRGFTP